MDIRHNTNKAALLVAVTLALAGCGLQDEQPGADATAGATTASSFPTRNSPATMTLADCDKLPDPKLADRSAAGRATAVSQGVTARAACKKEVARLQDKPEADLARIREIKEKEQADSMTRKISEKEWGKRINEGAGKPIKEYKY